MRRRLMIFSFVLAAGFALAGQPARADQKFIVFFHEWSAELDPAARDVVAAAAAYARQNPAMHVDIIGSASAKGSQRANMYLSLVRAQRISDMLARAGVDDARLSRIGEGSVATVGSDEEARRVEIVVRAP